MIRMGDYLNKLFRGRGACLQRLIEPLPGGNHSPNVFPPKLMSQLLDQNFE